MNVDQYERVVNGFYEGTAAARIDEILASNHISPSIADAAKHLTAHVDDILGKPISIWELEGGLMLKWQDLLYAHLSRLGGCLLEEMHGGAERYIETYDLAELPEHILTFARDVTDEFQLYEKLTEYCKKIK